MPGTIILDNGITAYALVTINGVVVPEPSEYQSQTSTLVNTGRAADGTLIGNVVREDIAKITLKWNFISANDWANLMALFSSNLGGNFTNPVEFFLQDTNSWDTRDMYVSDRKANVFIRNADGSIKGYKNASLSLVEV